MSHLYSTDIIAPTFLALTTRDIRKQTLVPGARNLLLLSLGLATSGFRERLDLAVRHQVLEAVVLVCKRTGSVRAHVLLEVLAHRTFASNLPLAAVLARLVGIAGVLVSYALRAFDDWSLARLLVTRHIAQCKAEYA